MIVPSCAYGYNGRNVRSTHTLNCGYSSTYSTYVLLRQLAFCSGNRSYSNISVSFHDVVTILPQPTLAYFFRELTQQPVVSRAEVSGSRYGQISEPDSVQRIVNNNMETKTKTKKRILKMKILFFIII